MKRHLLLAAFIASTVASPGASVIVDAGSHDRHNTIVQFPWPNSVKAPAALRDEKASIIPLQIEGAMATIVLPELKSGQRATLTFAEKSPDTNVKAEVSSNAVTLRVFGKTAFVYHTAKTELPAGRRDLQPIFRRAGYLHPVFSPSGALVTDDYPRNHKHHHGIWLSWPLAVFEGRTNDYWNMGEGKGTMEFVALDKTWTGPVHAGFMSRHQHVDLTSGTAKPALNEAWNVRLFAAGNGERKYFVFDVDVTNTCATASPVKLPEYRYGGICVRGNWAWNGRTNAFVLTNEGETDRNKGDKGRVRAKWIHMGGVVDGVFTGIAGFGHPSNVYSPEPVRLNPAEPYFNFTPQQAGDLEITPDKPWVGRYRFVVEDGKPDRAELDRMWNDYAHPPTVQVKP